MTIKQHGGVFGRNPTFNNVSVKTLSIDGTAISSTAAELNILDGVTADSTEINYLDGASTSVVTASKAVLANASANIAFASGNGIDFSATSGTGTSELFDDYEEGTWTPANVGSASISGTWDSTLTGTYTKIGRMVMCTFQILGTNMGFSALGGYSYYSGLPFSAAITAGASWASGALAGAGAGTVYITGSNVWIYAPMNTTFTSADITTSFVYYTS